jgi:hypothetical protein
VLISIQIYIIIAAQVTEIIIFNDRGWVTALEHLHDVIVFILGNVEDGRAVEEWLEE